MLYVVCVSRLGGEPLVNKCLCIVYKQFNEVRYTRPCAYLFDLIQRVSMISLSKKFV